MCFYRLAKLALGLSRPEAGLRLLAASYAIDRQLEHPDAEAQDLPAIQALADTLDISEPDLGDLLEEVARAYRVDRGQGLINEAFPELGGA